MQTPDRTTILDPESVSARRPAYKPVTTWQEPMLRGILAIVLGIVIFAFPLTATLTLALAFGVWVLVDGVLSVMHAVQNPHPHAGNWWAMLAFGVLGIVVGIFAVIFPPAAAVALGTLIAIWAVIGGGLQIATALRIHHDVPRETLLIALGALTIVFGLFLFVVPFVATLAVTGLLGVYAIIIGVGLVTYAFQLRRRTPGARAAI